MEDKFELTVDGQELTTDDLNTIASVGPMATDRTLAELLRVTPYNQYEMYGSYVTKCVIPSSYQGVDKPVVYPAGTADRKFRVNPFRAVIGSRTAEETDSLECWRDIRTVAFTGEFSMWEGHILADHTTGGSASWQLVYATVTLGAVQSSQTRWVKDPTTLVESEQTLDMITSDSVVVSVIAGTPDPVLPTDTPTVFHIPLAYVRSSGSGTQTLVSTDIRECSTIASLSRALGTRVVAPANGQNLAGGSVLVNTPWSATTNVRPTAFMPPTMVGEEVRYIALDLASDTSAGWSHLNGGVVDSSIDWRNRVCEWTAFARGGAKPFAWTPGASGETVPSYLGVVGTHLAHGMGQSFVNEGTYPIVMALTDGSLSELFTTSSVWLYVDPTTGELRVSITGTPKARLFIKLCASAQFGNK